MTRLLVRHLVCALIAVGLVGCPDRQIADRFPPALFVVLPEGDWVGLGETASISFGITVPGVPVEHALLLREDDLHRDDYELLGFEIEEGDVGGLDDEQARFRVGFEPGVVDEDGIPVVIRYVPSAVTGHALDRARIVLRARVDSEMLTVRVELSGRSVAPTCDAPDALEFGIFANGSSGRLELMLRNPTDLAHFVKVGAISSNAGDPLAFSFEELVPGEVQLAPRSERLVSVMFSPMTTGSHAASMVIEAGPGCAEKTVALRGLSVESLLEWSPSIVDCDYVQPGSEEVRTIEFRNNSSSDVLLSQIRTLSSVEFQILPAPGADPTVLTVPASSTAELQVACRPAQPGPRTTQLQFQTSLPEVPAGSIALKATGGSCLVFSPEDLDFGVVGIGCSSATRPLTLANRCAAPIVLTNFGMANAAGQPAGGPNCQGGIPCPEFIPVQTLPIPPGGLILHPGDEPLRVLVKYRPIDLGADVGAVQFTYIVNGRSESATVTLVGAASETMPMTNTFVVPAPEKADVLFVIDNSGNMGAVQTTVAQNLTEFIQQVDAAPFKDMNFAVTTCDLDPVGGEGGRFIFGPAHPSKVLHSSSPSLVAEFYPKTFVGTGGSGDERCVEASATALREPLISGHNAGFLRPDARLEVVWISNEPDVSTQSPAHWIQFFNDLKPCFGFGGCGGRITYRAHAINGFTSTCPGDDGSYAQYLDPRKESVSGNICDNTWGAQLAGVMLERTFTTPFLYAMPDLSKGPMTVVVDGTVVPERNAKDELVWTYSSLSNVVGFYPDHVPAPGSIVEVHYTASCYSP